MAKKIFREKSYGQVLKCICNKTLMKRAFKRHAIFCSKGNEWAYENKVTCDKCFRPKLFIGGDTSYVTTSKTFNTKTNESDQIPVKIRHTCNPRKKPHDVYPVHEKKQCSICNKPISIKTMKKHIKQVHTNK